MENRKEKMKKNILSASDEISSTDKLLGLITTACVALTTSVAVDNERQCKLGEMPINAKGIKLVLFKLKEKNCCKNIGESESMFDQSFWSIVFSEG